MSASRWIGFVAVLAAAMLFAPEYKSRVEREPARQADNRQVTAPQAKQQADEPTAEALLAECRESYPAWSEAELAACAEMRLEARGPSAMEHAR